MQLRDRGPRCASRAVVWIGRSLHRTIPSNYTNATWSTLAPMLNTPSTTRRPRFATGEESFGARRKKFCFDCWIPTMKREENFRYTAH